MRPSLNQIPISPSRRWAILILTSMTCMMIFASLTAYSVAEREIVNIFGISKTVAGLGTTIYAIGLVVGMIFGGFISDRIGIKGTVLTGMMLLIIPQFIIPSAGSFSLILALRFLQGLSFIAWAPFVACVVGWFTGKQKGFATGFYLGVALAGGMVGGFITGITLPSVGWKGTFYILGAVVAVFLILWQIVTVLPPKSGTVSRKQSGGYGLILRMKETWYLVLIMAGATWMLYTLLSRVPNYAFDLGYSEMEVGTLTTAIGIAYIVAALIAGPVSDILSVKSGLLKGKGICMGLGFGVAVVGSLLVPLAAGAGYGMLFAALFIAAFGNSWPQAIYWAVPSEVYDPEIADAGTGFAGGLGNIPDPIAPTVILAIAGSGAGWTMAWITCAVASAVGVAASFLLAGSKLKTR